MSLTENQQPVEAFPAHRPHPALGNRVRSRCLERGAHDPHTCRAEHRVEGGREVGIPVVDQERRAPALVLAVPGQLPGLLSDPGGLGVLRAAGDEHPPRVELDEEQHEQRL